MKAPEVWWLSPDVAQLLLHLTPLSSQLPAGPTGSGCSLVWEFLFLGALEAAVGKSGNGPPQNPIWGEETGLDQHKSLDLAAGLEKETRATMAGPLGVEIVSFFLGNWENRENFISISIKDFDLKVILLLRSFF